MCGIAGYWAPDRVDPGTASQLGNSMARAMKHRGPDHQNVWISQSDGIVLAHARLSIIDLSESANQPFVSPDGRYAIVYNGEVFNFPELRESLQNAGHIFHTGSDTEVVVQACAHWGVIEAIERFIGMFAFALWDSHDKRLTLARDRIGIKPLYYGNQGGTFLFSSTLAAIERHPAFERRISAEALAAYFRYSYVPSPHSIFSGIAKLPPGHVFSIDRNMKSSLNCYWSGVDVAQAGLASPFTGTDSELIDGLEALARDAVRRSMISDVPLGCFLSGGIDSSLVAALMQAESCQAIRTFTVGFSDARYDESGYARKVAHHLECEHTDIICSTREALDLIPSLPEYYDEPFADSSQIPTLLLSQLTRRSVTVALSGDGGDELFAGYDRYYWIGKLENILSRWHPELRGSFTAILEALPRQMVFAALKALPFGSKLAPMVDGGYHLARMMKHANDFKYLYQTTPMTVCAYRDNSLLVNDAEPRSVMDEEVIRAAIPSLLHWMLYVDQTTYLPDDILQKLDRASMAFSLEARVPLLDHRLFEFAWRTPKHLKLHRGRGKIIMRELLARFIPSQLIERPKRGFSIPLADWLKSDLRAWGQSLIDSSTAKNDQFLHKADVIATWNNFLTGRADHTLTTVWNLLIYLQWRSRYSN